MGIINDWKRKRKFNKVKNEASELLGSIIYGIVKSDDKEKDKADATNRAFWEILKTRIKEGIQNSGEKYTKRIPETTAKFALSKIAERFDTTNLSFGNIEKAAKYFFEMVDAMEGIKNTSDKNKDTKEEK
jgi:hypothetical protein